VQPRAEPASDVHEQVNGCAGSRAIRCNSPEVERHSRDHFHVASLPDRVDSWPPRCSHLYILAALIRKQLSRLSLYVPFRNRLGALRARSSGLYRRSGTVARPCRTAVRSAALRASRTVSARRECEPRAAP
jgi:hypothetical protein